MISDLSSLFDSLPNKSFEFEAIPHGEKDEDPIVVCKKKYDKPLYGNFDEVTVAITSSGKRRISFTRSYFSIRDVPSIISTINKIYSELGKDNSGDSSLNNKKIQDLKTAILDEIYSNVMVDWEREGKHYLMINCSTNSNFSILFSEVYSNNKESLLKEYYEPFVQRDANGLLIKRKEILDRNYAKIISNEFEDNKVIALTEVAGNNSETYVSTFSNNDTSILNRTTISISFIYSGGFFFLQLKSKDKLFHLDLGESIIFTFENEEIIEVSFENASTKQSHEEATTLHTLQKQELATFMTKGLKNWKLLKANRAYKTGGFSYSYLEPV